MNANNIQEKLGKGISVEAFIDKMTEEERQKFEKWHNQFDWEMHNQELLAPLKEETNLRASLLLGTWCGDVHRNLGPIWEVLKEANIPTEVFIMEEHEDLMDLFLTMGGRSVPKVIITNDAGDVLFDWGPRPLFIQQPMIEFKQKNLAPDDPAIDAERKKAYEGIFSRYGKTADYQKLVVYEITNLLLSAVQQQ
ncbi:thioredoxin family protein [Aliibacillus thermotolerans]|uniref:Thioredoxin family protein n=1 Tax=Aliibacillus thermotolerans TaxID=1834418 RepID=A0ABW0U6N7_9BACI|nr:thioredoxin family protein [Aliibacillus thermotolerans]MDA3130890.1 thioredoxin family protein [Aliibacillus thermotolerans]